MIYFGQSSLLKCKFLRLLSSRVKIRQIPYINFEMTIQFLFRFFIILHCHYTLLLCKFLAHAFSILVKRIPWKYQIWHFSVFWWRFAKFLISFFKPQVSFSSILHDSSVSWNITTEYFVRSNVIYFAQNFAPLFSIMRHNSSVLF